jgi:hypothetical protein
MRKCPSRTEFASLNYEEMSVNYEEMSVTPMINYEEMSVYYAVYYEPNNNSSYICETALKWFLL